MEELVARIVNAAGITPDQAQRTIGLILAFLRKEGPGDKIDELLRTIPGGEEAAAAGEDDKPSGGGLLGGLMGMLSGGGGLMGLASQLSGVGLGPSEMSAAGKELFAFAREKLGDDQVNEITGSIPGLRQFM
ncbi:MAG: DUF2267 domain-containing protein [Beijerinckiaceae bacterium]|nr:DUF2267 domain-containing protein [Beijerinckiaceae bacterium]